MFNSSAFSYFREVKNINYQWYTVHWLSTSLAISIISNIITCTLGEHDPGSAPDWRAPNDFCSPGHQHQHLARSWRVNASTSFARSTFFPTKCFTHPRLPHCIISHDDQRIRRYLHSDHDGSSSVNVFFLQTFAAAAWMGQKSDGYWLAITNYCCIVGGFTLFLAVPGVLYISMLHHQLIAFLFGPTLQRHNGHSWSLKCN